MIASTICSSPLGALLIAASDAGVTRVAFAGSTTPDRIATATGGAARRHLDAAISELDEYLTGSRRQFSVPIDWRAVSAFDREVLAALQRSAPYGQTTTYTDLALAVGRPVDDARKIGGALARNRMLIIVPCHRVVGMNGALTGYAGGLAAKRRLLDLELDYAGSGLQFCGG